MGNEAVEKFEYRRGANSPPVDLVDSTTNYPVHCRSARLSPVRMMKLNKVMQVQKQLLQELGHANPRRSGQ